MSRLWPRFVAACRSLNDNGDFFHNTNEKKRNLTYNAGFPPIQKLVHSTEEEDDCAVDGEHGQDDRGEGDRGQRVP